MKHDNFFNGKKLIMILLVIAISCVFPGCSKKTVSIEKNKKTAETTSSEAVSAQALDVPSESVTHDGSDTANNSNQPVSNSSENANPENNSASDNRAITKLSVSGGKLVDTQGNPIQLHGVSTHGLSWFPEYVNREAFLTMRDDWGVDTVRLAMYSAEYNGYCTGGNQAQLKQTVHNGVDYATELGMYVIIDWHILSDGNPNTYINEAAAFFKEMADTYKNYDNVIFEICNEPNGGTSWSDIKNYAGTILSVIRGAGADNVVLIGTPTWSQDIHLAADSPITGYDNIMYTFHFYAGTHKTDLQNRLKDAINRGVPVFVSEFGITDASGNGNVDIESANTWMSILNSNNISTVCWNLSNKNESSSLIQNSCPKNCGWSYNELSEEGKWLVDTYKGSLSSNGTSSVTDNTNSSTGVGQNSNVQNSYIQNNSNNHHYEQDHNYNESQHHNYANNGAGKASINCNQVNSWNDGSNDYYQYEVIISNVGNCTLTGWNANISFSGNIELNQSWCCNCNANGSSISFSPLDYNQNLEPGASANIGFIVKGPASLQIAGANIN